MAGLALLLGGRAWPALAQEAAPKETRQQLSVALSAPGKPGFLEVQLIHGFIHVSGYGGKTVEIEATARAPRSSGRGDEPPAVPGGLRRIAGAGNRLSLTAEERNNHVEITTGLPPQITDLTIRVPRSFSLKVSTINQGDVLVENVAGELEVSNVNGPIVLRQVAGSAVASTVNGSLTATFSSVTAGAPMAFSTLNGKLDVTLPGTAHAALKLKSDRGNVYSDFDVAVRKSPPVRTRDTQNGLTRLSTDDWTYGTLNGGGPEIMLKTMNGDIFLRKAK